MRSDCTLRIQAAAPFCLRWSRDDWQTVENTASTATTLGIEFVDLAIAPDQHTPIRFTFFWTQVNHWEQRNYEIAVTDNC